MRPRPLIAPVQTLEEYHAERLGYQPQREIVSDLEELARRSPSLPFVFAHSLPPYFRANVGGSGDATYNMRIGTPSSDSAWAMVDLALPMPMAGNLMGGVLWASEVCTAGTATLEVQIVDAAGTRNVVIPGCVISTQPGDTQAVSAFLFNSTVRFSRTATIKPRITTAGTYSPNTADMGALLLVQYD